MLENISSTVEENKFYDLMNNLFELMNNLFELMNNLFELHSIYLALSICYGRYFLAHQVLLNRVPEQATEDRVRYQIYY